PADGRWQPRAPTLDLALDTVRPRPPAAPESAAPADPAAVGAGRDLMAVMQDAQAITLAGIRVTDFRGVVVASTGEELGRSLAEREEVARAPRRAGEPAPRARLRGSAPAPRLARPGDARAGVRRAAGPRRTPGGRGGRALALAAQHRRDPLREALPPPRRRRPAPRRRRPDDPFHLAHHQPAA